MGVLLVQPAFPHASKSKNHHTFLPIGLLKLASYYRNCGETVQLVRGNVSTGFVADKVLITSLFTYWSEYVWDSVRFYRKHYPNAKIIVGGIYASLMPEHCKQSGCDEVFIGVHNEAEKHIPAYDLVDVDYQIIHSSRGCIRHCKFCGTWRIEPEFKCKETVLPEIRSNKLIFYDNNLLANPHIKNILEEISNFQYGGKPIKCECQSGFDCRLLTHELAQLLKKARFENPRIAWDGPYAEHSSVYEKLRIFFEVGYKPKDMFVFMIYNFDLDFDDMERKRKKCLEWGVQIADCRYRPLNQTFDNYNSHARKQTSTEYYIHSNWSDKQIRRFRRNVRRQNIAIRFGLRRYCKNLERVDHAT